MMAHRAQQVASRQSSRRCVLSNLWRATQGEECIVRDAAEWRTQDRRQSQFVSGVIEKPQQLNQIGNLFALIEAFALYRQIRNAGAAQRAFVNPNAGERAEKDCDVAVSELVRRTRVCRRCGRDVRDPSANERIDSFDHLRGVTFASVKTIA